MKMKKALDTVNKYAQTTTTRVTNKNDEKRSLVYIGENDEI